MATTQRAEIREFTAQDLEAVIAISAASPEAPEWSRSIYETLLHDPPAGAACRRIAVVAVTAGQPGTSPQPGGTILLGFAVASLLVSVGEAELETIVVDERFRRRGLGTRLLDALRTRLIHLGAGALRLEVRESNAAAIALYQTQGFHPAGRRPAYYHRPPEDALVFEWLAV